MEKYLIPEVYLPILYIAGAIFVNALLKYLIAKSMKVKIGKRTFDGKRQKTLIRLFQNIARYFIWFVVLLAILDVYGFDTTTLLAGAGVLGLAVGFGAQDLVRDFLSGFFIIFENQFGVGDIIEIDGFRGEVTQLGLKTTKLKNIHGDIKIISNRNITAVTNCSISDSLALVDVTVSYEADIRKVEKVLTELAKKLSKEIKEVTGEIQLLGIQELADSSIVFRLSANTKPMEHYAVQRKILREVKLVLDKEGIEIPYAQLVIHNK